MMIPGWLRPHWREALLALVILTPWLSLLAFGVVWLHEHGALIPWLAGSALFGVIVWPIRRSLRRSLRANYRNEVERLSTPSPEWTEREGDALTKVKALAGTVLPASFTDLDALRDLAWNTVGLVAKDFRPHDRRPEFDITIPELLLVSERIMRDTRSFFIRTVPGARSIKLGHLLLVQEVGGRWAPMASGAYTAVNTAYNLYLLVANPVAGAARLAKGATSGQALDLLVGNARSYGTQIFVLEVGRAAIDLYSGRLRLSDAELVDAANAEEPSRPARSLLPRMVFVGQVNAGKSSLVNALAKDVVCDVRSIPTEGGTVEHHLTIDGSECAIMVDMAGLMPTRESRDALARALADADLIVWAVSAVQPGRAADVVAMAHLREAHAANSTVRRAPIIIALTHVDLLSPKAEWLPPYNVVEPSGRKEVLMRRAMEAVSATLAVEAGSVVPVAMPGGTETWNTEFLWGCISARLDDAKFRQLERLRLKHSAGSWKELAGQSQEFFGNLANAAIGRRL